MDVATLRRGFAAMMVGTTFGVVTNGLLHYFNIG